MKEVIDDIEQWLDRDEGVALATVVSTSGSSPRELGAVMAVSNSGKVIGSISGGCVEGAVVVEALAAIATGQPQLLTYGVTDELGLSIGLTCGGSVQVFVEPLGHKFSLSNIALADIFQAIRQAFVKPLALCTMVEGLNVGAKLVVGDLAPTIGSLGNDRLDRAVTREARSFLMQGIKGSYSCGMNGEYQQTGIVIFIESFVPPPHLIIFGAVDFTCSLCELGKLLGYRVTVCDARSLFATSARFPKADEVVVSWPSQYLQNTTIDHRTVIVVLTHDPKFDVPILATAVHTPAVYIGAMGSRKAHADRLQRLKEVGLNETELARISAPTGLDIGACTPAETAVSIMAEVVAIKAGRDGGKLSSNQNTIHVREKNEADSDRYSRCG
jgi:xanthine dehydrogenase accessory factor